jgi:hypothetical protein
MLKHAAIPVFLVILVLGIWIAWISWNGFLNSQTQKDKQLGRMTAENLKNLEQTRDNFVSLKCVGPGEYVLEARGLQDANEAGRFGYNAMVVLDERNTVVMTGRTSFLIHGFQGGEPIFDVTWNLSGLPKVTLLGPYEGTDYAPAFGHVERGPVDSDNPKVTVFA